MPVSSSKVIREWREFVTQSEEQFAVLLPCRSHRQASIADAVTV